MAGEARRKAADAGSHGGSPGRRGTAVAVLEPIRDPFLADYLDELRQLTALVPDQSFDAERACELARDIFLRLVPPESPELPFVRDAIALMGQAVERISINESDELSQSFRRNIEARREALAQFLDQPKST